MIDYCSTAVVVCFVFGNPILLTHDASPDGGGEEEFSRVSERG